MGYPSDADGDALRRVERCGADMSRPMLMDFHVAVPDEAAGKAMGKVAGRLGYRVEVYESEGCKLPWTCQCSTRMLATYDGVLAIQHELAEVAARFGGFPDGWGTYGNRDDVRGKEGEPPA